MTRPEDAGPPSDDSDVRDTLRLAGHARAHERASSEHVDRHPVLVVVAGNEIGLRCRVDRPLSVGRDPDADVCLTDPGVSWQHARVEEDETGERWVIVDAGSTNGVVVNGQRVPRAELAPNDTIVLGRTVVQFELHDTIDQAFDAHVEFFLSIDDLSGLFVRKRFESELTRILASARASKQSLGLLVLDLDGVKAINDTHGHLFGAFVIGEAGRRMGERVGVRGIAARFGGDEFAIALPGFDRASSLAFAHEVLDAVSGRAFVKDGVELRVGVSIGVAVFPDEGTDSSVLFERADHAMYRAKREGRNRVCA